MKFSRTLKRHLVEAVVYNKRNRKSTLNLCESKVVLSNLRKFFATESPLKVKKNALYFILKSLFGLKVFKILSWLLVMQRNSLIGNIRIISKFICCDLENKHLWCTSWAISEEKRPSDNENWSINRI